MSSKKIKVGDRITFRAVVFHSPIKRMTRKVVEIDQEGRPCVRAYGYSHFVVRPCEVIEVLAA